MPFRRHLRPRRAGDAAAVPVRRLGRRSARVPTSGPARACGCLSSATIPTTRCSRITGDDSTLPSPMKPVAVLCLSDELRPDARPTLESFVANGVTPKIISGDNPETVAALARQAGFAARGKVISGIELATMRDGAFGQAARGGQHLRPHHAAAEGAAGPCAAQPGPLRGDDGRRRERRAVAQEGQPGHCDAVGHAGDPLGGRHRAAQRLVRGARARRRRRSAHRQRHAGHPQAVPGRALRPCR